LYLTFVDDWTEGLTMAWVPGIVFLAGMCTVSGEGEPGRGGASWRFVLPPPGDPFEHPPFRALVLSREKPEDVTEKLAYRGSTRRYAQVRFGSPASVRVTVVIDEAAPGDVDLFVDANRDRKIDERDRVDGERRPSGHERLWRLPLDVAVVEGEATRLIRRAAVFRLGASGRTLGYASAGYLEGIASVGGEPRSVRRTDGDGNGLLTDAQDRIWIDLDQDGRWDSSAEQFLFTTVLNLDGARYVVRSDPLGLRLGLDPLVGTGSIRLAIGNGKGAELHATVVGPDGSAFGLTGTKPVTLPVGEYRLSSVAATFDDPKGGPSWTFVFSDNLARGAPRWYRIEQDRETVIDPIGRLAMELSVADKAAAVRAGEDASLQPLLFTGDGLLINVAYRGSPASPAAQESLGTVTTLAAIDGRMLGHARSGFS
jgi:hypothetical protein